MIGQRIIVFFLLANPLLIMALHRRVSRDLDIRAPEGKLTIRAEPIEVTNEDFLAPIEVLEVLPKSNLAKTKHVITIGGSFRRPFPGSGTKPHAIGGVFNPRVPNRFQVPSNPEVSTELPSVDVTPVVEATSSSTPRSTFNLTNIVNRSKVKWFRRRGDYINYCPATCFIFGTLGVYEQPWMGDINSKTSDQYAFLMGLLQFNFEAGIKKSTLDKFSPVVKVIDVTHSTDEEKTLDEVLEVEYFIMLNKVNLVLTPARLMSRMTPVFESVNTPLTVVPEFGNSSLHIISTKRAKKFVSGVIFNRDHDSLQKSYTVIDLLASILILGAFISLSVILFFVCKRCGKSKRRPIRIKAVKSTKKVISTVEEEEEKPFDATYTLPMNHMRPKAEVDKNVMEDFWSRLATSSTSSSSESSISVP